MHHHHHQGAPLLPLTAQIDYQVLTFARICTANVEEVEGLDAVRERFLSLVLRFMVVLGIGGVGYVWEKGAREGRDCLEEGLLGGGIAWRGYS